jgi:hypothetical protein
MAPATQADLTGAREREVSFPDAAGDGSVRGILHEPAGEPSVALVLAHGRSGGMNQALLRGLARAAAGSGWLVLRFNFRYVESKGRASRDLSREEGDLLSAVRFVRRLAAQGPLIVAGKSMGARVAARASHDPGITAVIALGYPLHPPFRPEVRDPPEWPKLVKPALFVQGDRDPFCDLARLREDVTRLPEAHDLVVIPGAGHSFEPKGPKRDTFPEVRDAVVGWVRRRFPA